jgi:hypothetical protein
VLGCVRFALSTGRNHRAGLRALCSEHQEESPCWVACAWSDHQEDEPVARRRPVTHRDRFLWVLRAKSQEGFSRLAPPMARAALFGCAVMREWVAVWKQNHVLSRSEPDSPSTRAAEVSANCPRILPIRTIGPKPRPHQRPEYGPDDVDNSTWRVSAASEPLPASGTPRLTTRR